MNRKPFKLIYKLTQLKQVLIKSFNKNIEVADLNILRVNSINVDQKQWNCYHAMYCDVLWETDVLGKSI